MKTETKIFFAFILNLVFSVFEFIGGSIAGSVSIASDAIHDLGDAISIGVSYGLEKYSKKRPNHTHTYGYARYSTLGALITTAVLVVGSLMMITESAERLANPQEINHDAMIGFAIVGVIVNFIAVMITNRKENTNQRAVNLHMLEDVMGWFAVLVGAIVIRFTGLTIIDPILSICVASFIFASAIKNLKPISMIFMEATPDTISISEIKKHLKEIEGVTNIHHIHLWSADEQHVYATMHVEIESYNESSRIKSEIREELKEHGVSHVVIETELSTEECLDPAHKNQKIEANHHHH